MKQSRTTYHANVQLFVAGLPTLDALAAVTAALDEQFSNGGSHAGGWHIGIDSVILGVPRFMPGAEVMSIGADPISPASGGVQIQLSLHVSHPTDGRDPTTVAGHVDAAIRRVAKDGEVVASIISQSIHRAGNGTSSMLNELLSRMLGAMQEEFDE